MLPQGKSLSSLLFPPETQSENRRPGYRTMKETAKTPAVLLDDERKEMHATLPSPYSMSVGRKS